MSWFHKDRGGKVHPILKHADYTTILGAEIHDGRLTKLCYTGHALSEQGVVQAIVPGGSMLWRTQFAEEYDVRDGHVAVAQGIVVTRVKDGAGHAIVGHDLWTGEEKWRRPVARMVTRMGFDSDRTLVFVTLDHAVHAITVATGEDHQRDPVMTDQAASSVINSTTHPTQAWYPGNRGSAPTDWSNMHAPSDGLEVYERDWAGTNEFGIGLHPDIQLVGSGSYEGSILVGDLAVLAFKLDRDGARHHHWYLYARSPVAMLGVMREDGKSELYEHGHVVWKGSL